MTQAVLKNPALPFDGTETKMYRNIVKAFGLSEQPQLNAKALGPSMQEVRAEQTSKNVIEQAEKAQNLMEWIMRFIQGLVQSIIQFFRSFFQGLPEEKPMGTDKTKEEKANFAQESKEPAAGTSKAAKRNHVLDQIAAPAKEGSAPNDQDLVNALTQKALKLNAANDEDFGEESPGLSPLASAFSNKGMLSPLFQATTFMPNSPQKLSAQAEETLSEVTDKIGDYLGDPQAQERLFKAAQSNDPTAIDRILAEVIAKPLQGAILDRAHQAENDLAGKLVEQMVSNGFDDKERADELAKLMVECLPQNMVNSYAEGLLDPAAMQSLTELLRSESESIAQIELLRSLGSAVERAVDSEGFAPEEDAPAPVFAQDEVFHGKEESHVQDQVYLRDRGPRI